MKNLYVVVIWSAVFISYLNQGFTKDAVYIAPALTQRFQNLNVQFERRLSNFGFLIMI